MSETLPALDGADPAKQPGMSRKRVELARLMAQEAIPLEEACERVGLTKRSGYYSLQTPAFCRYHNQLLAAMRQAERGRNLQRAIELRDQDENKRTALDAVRHLEGGDERPHNVVNLGVNLFVRPGYIVDLNLGAQADELRELLAKSGSTKNAFDLEAER